MNHQKTTYKDFLCLQVRRCQDKIQLLIFRNQTQILVKKYSPQEIKSLAAKHKDDIVKNILKDSFFLKESLSFGEIYLSLNTSIYWVQNLKALSQFSSTTISIKTLGNVSVENIICENMIVRANKMHFFAANEIKESFYFINNVGHEERKFYTQQKVKIPKGLVTLEEKARLGVGRMRIDQGDLILSRNSGLKLTENSFFMSQNSNITVLFEAKMYGTQNLTIKCSELKNQGYIAVKNQKEGTLIIQCDSLESYGHLKNPRMNIYAHTLVNHKQGIISTENGKLSIGLRLKNQGQIDFPCILGGFVDRSASPFIESVINSGRIVSKKFSMKGYILENKGLIATQNLKFLGQKKKSLFKNEFGIHVEELQIIDAIFINSQQAFIISRGMTDIYIDGWINNGQIQNSKSAYVKINGSLNNKGSLKFNSQLFIQGHSLYNKAFLKADNANIKLKEVFLNDQGGVTKIKKAHLESKKILNLCNFEIAQPLLLNAKFFENLKQLKFINGGSINVDYIQNEENGVAFVNKANIKGEKIKNKGQMIINESNVTLEQNSVNHGQAYFHNGQINMKQHMNDKKNAKTEFEKMKYNVMQDPTLNLNGDISFKATKVQGAKNIYSSKNMDLEGTKIEVSGFRINNIVMKNAQVSFGTFDQEESGKITDGGGRNALRQMWSKVQKEQENKKNDEKKVKQQKKNVQKEHETNKNGKTEEKPNQQKEEGNFFDIDIMNERVLKKIQIVCTNEQVPTHINIQYNNDQKSGWNLLFHPIAIGNFTKQLTCQNFTLPFNVYEQNIIKKAWKQIKGVNPNLFEKYNGLEIPNLEQKHLTIATPHLMFGGKLSYQGQNLTLKNQFTDLKLASIQVPNGILQIDSQEAILATHAYLNAKGIKINTTKLATEAVKFVANAENILIKAIHMTDRPTINRRTRTTYWKNEKTTRNWQEGHRSTFYAEGHIVMFAEEYLGMISPLIEAKKQLIINSKNTMICGMFLLDESITEVTKSKMFGGSKTNIYMSRNDKPLPAFLKGQNITIAGGKANINATMTGNRLADLTNQGLKLGFVIGYSAEMENRQFCNFCTQGVQGYQRTTEKFLKCNLIDIRQIIRPAELGGEIIFDTVQWGKIKPIINAKYQELIKIPKTWYTSWEHESIGPGIMMVISFAAAWAGGNLLAPMLCNALTITSAIAVSATKAACATIMSKFATTFVATGNLGMALKAVFSIDTVLSAAANIAIDIAVQKLAPHLGIILKPSAKDIPGQVPEYKSFLNILKKNVLTCGLRTGVEAIKGQNFSNLFEVGIKTIMADTMGEYFGFQIGQKWGQQSGINYVIHKALHGVLGAAKGLIMGGNITAMVSGAVGAMIAEIAIQACVSKEDMVKAKKEAKQKGLSNEEFLNEAFQNEKFICKMMGAIVGGLCGDLDNAMRGACDAIDYNHQATLQQFASDIDFLMENDKVVTLNELEEKQGEEYDEDGRAVAVAKLAYSDELRDKKGNDPEELKKPFAGLNLQINEPTAKEVHAHRVARFQQIKAKHGHLFGDGYKIDKPVENKELRTDVIVIRSQKLKKIYIGIQGTDFSLGSHNKQDAKIFINDKPFAARYDRDKNYVEDIIKQNPNFKVHIIGHSLGGNITENICYDLKGKYANFKGTSFNTWHIQHFSPFQFIQEHQQKRLAIKNDPNIKRFQVKGQWFGLDKGAVWGKGGHALTFFDGMMHSKKEIMKQMKPKQFYNCFKLKIHNLYVFLFTGFCWGIILFLQIIRFRAVVVSKTFDLRLVGLRLLLRRFSFRKQGH